MSNPVPPDISVIIANFERPRELAAAIGSVLAQESTTTDGIVVADADDGSAESVLESFATPQVSYPRNKPPLRGRPALARNFGWPKAQGDLVHSPVDDDIVPADYYAAAKQVLAENAGVGVAFGRIEPFGEGDVASERAYFAAASRRARCLGRFGERLGYSAVMLFRPTSWSAAPR